MSGESKLDVLLQTMRPVLHPEPFTFCTIAGHNLTQLSASVLHSALGLFREAEGITAILPVADAEQAGLVSHGGWALITLSIHSDLNAVGFLAAVTARLADAKISVNAVSAYYHDHLFVPWDDRERAMYTAATFELMSTIGQGKQILVVDDEPNVVWLIATRLRQHAYSVESARTGEEALEKAKNSPFDLIVSDVMMPVMDGFELLRAVRGDPSLTNVRFILLTTRPNDEPPTTAPREGPWDAVLYKPFNPRQLLSEVARVLQLIPPPENAPAQAEVKE